MAPLCGTAQPLLLGYYRTSIGPSSVDERDAINKLYVDVPLFQRSGLSSTLPVQQFLDVRMRASAARSGRCARSLIMDTDERASPDDAIVHGGTRSSASAHEEDAWEALGVVEPQHGVPDARGTLPQPGAHVFVPVVLIGWEA